MARRMRDRQWAFADQVAEHGVVWFCWWDKDRRHKGKTRPYYFVTGLLDGMEMLAWLNGHPAWWEIGKWCDQHYAAPVRLTPEGLNALENRAVYDLEPVEFGMVEPGYIAIPAELEQ